MLSNIIWSWHAYRIHMHCIELCCVHDEQQSNKARKEKKRITYNMQTPRKFRSPPFQALFTIHKMFTFENFNFKIWHMAKFHVRCTWESHSTHKFMLLRKIVRWKQQQQRARMFAYTENEVEDAHARQFNNKLYVSRHFAPYAVLRQTKPNRTEPNQKKLNRNSRHVHIKIWNELLAC